MRTKSCASRAGWFLLILSGLVSGACAQSHVAAPPQGAKTVPGVINLPEGGTLRFSTAGNQTAVELVPTEKSAKKQRIMLARDATIAPKSAVEPKLIAEVGKRAVIVTDQNQSKPGSMSYCGAGQETFLRVLAIEGGLRQTFQIKVESCRGNLELASPGIVWKAETATLEVHWLTGPGENEHNQTRSYQIGERGEVKPL